MEKLEQLVEQIPKSVEGGFYVALFFFLLKVWAIYQTSKMRRLEIETQDRQEGSKQEQSDFDIVNARLNADLDRAEKRRDELETENRDLRNELLSCERKRIQEEAAYHKQIAENDKKVDEAEKKAADADEAMRRALQAAQLSRFLDEGLQLSPDRLRQFADELQARRDAGLNNEDETPEEQPNSPDPA